MSRDRKGKREEQPKLSRRDYVLSVCRQPVQWDVLFFWLSRELTKTTLATRGRLRSGPGRFSSSQAVTAGLIGARVLDAVIRQRCGAAAGELRAYELAVLDNEAIQEICKQFINALKSAMACHIESVEGGYVPLRHPNLDLLAGALVETTRRFLIEHALPGGDMHASLAEPLADHHEFFPDLELKYDKPIPTGDLNFDVHHLGPVVASGDDGAEMKRKLIAFSQSDPWLKTTEREAVEEAIHNAQASARTNDDLYQAIRMATIGAIDGFLFRHNIPCGRTPIEHWIAQQPLLSPQQREHLQAWNDWTFFATFKVTGSVGDGVRVLDLLTDQTLDVFATSDTPASKLFETGQYLMTRIVPYGDHWLLSGYTQLIPRMSKAEQLEFEVAVKKSRPNRKLQRGAPWVEASFQENRDWYDAWIELFGTDESLFPTGLDAAAAMARHLKYMRDERIHPRTGMTPRDAFLRDHGCEPPQIKEPLPTELLEADDVSILLDPEWGTQILVGYGGLRDAMRSTEAPKSKNVELLREYIEGEDIDWWVLKRLKDRYPERMTEIVRLAMGDPHFELDEFDNLIRKFKGEQLRIGPIPSTMMSDIGDQLMAIEDGSDDR